MPKKKKDVGKIYTTTDGYLSNKPYIKKKREVAAVDQRKDDGALAVVKIYSKKNKDGKAFIDKLVLRPQEHSSLTEDSIVGKQIYIGIKSTDKAGKATFKPIFTRDLRETNDKLTKREQKIVKKGIKGNSSKDAKIRKTTRKRWHNHFGKKQ